MCGAYLAEDSTIFPRYFTPFGAAERIYDVIDGKCDISVQLGDMSPYTESIALPEGFVVFNFIISEVEISP